MVEFSFIHVSFCFDSGRIPLYLQGKMFQAIYENMF